MYSNSEFIDLATETIFFHLNICLYCTDCVGVGPPASFSSNNGTNLKFMKRICIQNAVEFFWIHPIGYHTASSTKAPEGTCKGNVTNA